MVSVTGHSLGGALAELTAKFFGLAGSNIDGPGVDALIGQDQYRDLQKMVRAEFQDLKPDYALSAADFGAYAYSLVGVAGTHIAGIEVQKTSLALAAEVAMDTASTPGLTPNALLALPTAVAHPSGLILLQTEGLAGLHALGPFPASPYTMLGFMGPPDLSVPSLGSPTLARLGIEAAATVVETNVKNGLSPSGLSLDGSAVRNGSYTMFASRDQVTGRITEWYTLVDEQGNARGATIKAEYAVDDSGRVGQYGADGSLAFVVRNADEQFAGVLTVAADGMVTAQAFNGERSQFSMPAGAASFSSGGDWLGAISAGHPINKLFDDDLSAVQPDSGTAPVSYPGVIYHGEIFALSPRGTLDRALPGSPGWSESRDSTGGGVIMDANGDVVAVLQPGDRVSQMDDGRFVINDAKGQIANRMLDAGFAQAFYTVPSVPEPGTRPNAQSDFRHTEIESQNAAAALEAHNARLSAATLGLVNTLIGLQNWEQQSDLGRATTLVAIYNQVNGLTDGALGNKGLGDLGTAGAVLGMWSALESGNTGGIIVNGIALADLAGMHASQAVASMLGLGQGAADGVVPGIGLIMALDSGNPMAIASSSLSLLSSLGMIGPWGATAAIAIAVLSSMFSDNDQPMHEGMAQAAWDDSGHLQVLTTLDANGGGASATGWMNQITGYLNAQLAGMTDGQGQPLYGLIPARLPAIGYQFDPDGFNYQSASGHLYLQWTDDNGQVQTRYYNGAGNRADGSGETLGSDFMRLAADAIVPAWEADTLLAHWQDTRQSQGLEAANAQARQAATGSLPQEDADHLTQSFHALTFELPGTGGAPQARPAALVDIDKDGYLELTQWFGSREGVLAIDLNGDASITTDELLDTEAPGSANGKPGHARNSAAWLDINHDGRLDARDPAFAVLRVWMDANGDGQSQSGELQDFQRAGITALDFSHNPPRLERADGSSTELTLQNLTGDVRGTAMQVVDGGVLQATEGGETVLHALNTQAFDGQEAHMHGGQAVQAQDEQELPAIVNIGAGDARLRSTTAQTVMGTSTQSQAAAGTITFSTAEAGTVKTGQAQGSTQGQTIGAGSPQLRSDPPARPLAFVPAGATSPGQAVREAIKAGTSGDAGGLFGANGAFVAVAVGLSAAQSPVWAAAQPGRVDDVDGMKVQAPSLQHEGGYSMQPGGDAAPSGGYTPLAHLPEFSPVSGEDIQSAAPSAARTEPPQVFQTARLVTSWEGAQGTGQPAVTPSVASPASSSGDPADTLRPLPDADTRLAYPTVRGERMPGTEDTGLRVPESLLLQNDSTPNATVLHIVSVGDARHGQVALRSVSDAMGGVTLEVVFIPEADFHGQAGFRYTVSDPYGLQTTGWATLDIEGVNDAPVTRGETLQSLEDAGLLFTPAQLLANDQDADIATDGDSLRVSRVGLATHGTVWLDADGAVRFLPDANYNGPAGVGYWVADQSGLETPATVSITVLPVNDLPVAQGEMLDTDEDTILTIDPADLLANDSDVDTSTDGQVLSITAVGDAQHGTVSLLPDGRISFVPDADFNGQASFNYTVDDGAGGTATAVALVRLAPVNDAPLVTGETVTFNEDEIQTITQAALLANDVDVDNPRSDLRIVAVGNATHGSVELGQDGSIRYVPDADYFGPAGFTYTVSDGAGGFTVGTATLDIQAVNDAPRLQADTASVDEDQVLHLTPAQLLANDSDVDNPHADLQLLGVGGALHGEVRLVDGEIVFKPELNFFGQAGFTYTVSDGAGGESQASVRLTFNPVNDAPVVNNELLQGKQGVTYTLSQAALLANDTDAETPDGLRIVELRHVQNGTATLAADGSVTFVPQAGFNGVGSFEYLVSDPDGAQSTGQASIDFSRANVAPIATDDSFSGYEDIPFIIGAAELLVNDRDPDAGGITPLTVDTVRNPSHGSVALQSDGSVRFNPDANYHGGASFEYRINDGEGGVTWATAFLNVASVNDAPVIEDIWYGTPIYGYQLFSLGSGRDKVTWDEAVHDEALALQLASRGELFDKVLVPPTSFGDAALADSYRYPVATTSYYLNGHLRPLHIQAEDATIPAVRDGDGVHVPAIPIDDRYRQHGKVIAWDPDGDSGAITISLDGGPQHGHAFANVFTPDSAPRDLTHERAQPKFVTEGGAWQYYSHYGDLYTGDDPFRIRVTDAEGASTVALIRTSHEGSSASGGGSCPIVIDLKGDGIQLIRPEDSVIFADVNGDGWRERIGWASNGDGVLTFDADGDGQVNLDTEVSFVGYLPNARTDLEGLAAFDTNGDGQLSAHDAAWSRFGVFQDANGNGVQDAEELVSLDALGITSIGLTRQGTAHLNNGNVVFGTATVGYADGREGVAADVMFAGAGVPLPVDALKALQDAAMGQARDPSAAAATADPVAMGVQLAPVDAGTVAFHAVAPAPSLPARAHDPLPATAGQDGSTPLEAITAAVGHVPPAGWPDTVIAASPQMHDEARLMQMALVFNQYCNTGDASAPPLGFVHWSDAGAAIYPDGLGSMPFEQATASADIHQLAAAVAVQSHQGAA